MENEAGLAVVVSMRDQLSGPMQQVGQTMRRTREETVNMRFAMMAVGGVMMHLSSLLNQLDNPLAKNAADFLRMAGYIVMTVNSIALLIPQIRSLITWLRSLAAAQALVGATGTAAGAAGIGGLLRSIGTGAGLGGLRGGLIGAGIGAVVGIGAYALSKAGQQTTINNTVNVQGSVITERELGEINRQYLIKKQGRDGTSGLR